jgi:hypothetical protein
MRSRSLAAASLGLAALLAAATTTAGASTTGVAAQTCTPKQNVEAIIDDSGSMLITDDGLLRVRAMELFIDNPANEKRTLGAIEFGTDAQPLFPPAVISQNRASMKSALAAISANNGLTDYNDAFTFAGVQNPNATARIFLTDGAHNNEDSSAYANGHRGGPPVYVIGLGVVGDGDTVLQQIANETGGLYRRANTSSELQSAMFDLNAAISCLATPITLRNTFTKVGTTQRRSVRLPAGVRSVNTALSWDDPANAFDVVGIRVVRKGKTVARPAAIRKLRVTKRRGATFVTAKISRLVRGKLVFKLKATRLGSPGASVQLTTQVVRSKTG